MVAEKRKADSSSVVPIVLKKIRNEVTVSSNRNKQVATSNYPRTSNLHSPIMLLDGHEGEIFTLDFHPEGAYLASSGFDRQIFLWTVYGECGSISVLSGHTGAVTQLKFSVDGNSVFTSSTDKTLGLWDLIASKRVRKFRGHMSFANAVSVARRGPEMICSGSDDRAVKIWDSRIRTCASSLNAIYQVTAVAFNETAEQIFSGGIDNDIKVWDARKHELLFTLKGHTDTVTGLALSADGTHLLSNAMDNSLRMWDIRSYAPQDRCVKVFQGHQHNFEKNLIRCNWSPDGSKIICGSADRFVYVWDVNSRRLLYKLPGHNGSVNDVAFHPDEPIIVSGSGDKQIYLGEIDQ